MNSEEYQVRLRHVAGDLGPYTLPIQTTAPELADLACAEWPEEGPLSQHKPNTPAEIRLISCGRFVDNSQTLGSIAAALGPLPPDVAITLHLVVRPAGSGKGGSVKIGDASIRGGESGCCCCIS